MADKARELQTIVETLSLEPHPEGGWYRQTYISSGSVPAADLPHHSGDRAFATSIYFLLSKGNFSAFHRIKSDEVWYHHDGGAVEIITIDKNGSVETLLVGSASEGFQAQAVVPAGLWFASRCLEGSNWSLMGCAVAPGFDFADFELADRSALTAEYPDHTDLILSLTRQG